MENETKLSLTHDEVVEAIVIASIAIATKVEISSIHQRVRFFTTSGAGTKDAKQLYTTYEYEVDQAIDRLLSKGKVSIKVEETVFSQQFFSLSDDAR